MKHFERDRRHSKDEMIVSQLKKEFAVRIICKELRLREFQFISIHIIVVTKKNSLKIRLCFNTVLRSF